MKHEYYPKICVPTQERNREIAAAQSTARQQMAALERQARIQGKGIFAGRLIDNKELNDADDSF